MISAASVSPGRSTGIRAASFTSEHCRRELIRAWSLATRVPSLRARDDAAAALSRMPVTPPAVPVRQSGPVNGSISPR